MKSKDRFAIRHHRLLALNSTPSDFQRAQKVTDKYLLREELEIAKNYLIRQTEHEALEKISDRMYKNKIINDEWLERLDKKKVQSLLRAYRGKTRADLTKSFMAAIRKRIRNVKQHLDPTNSEHIVQKLSLLTQENVSDCLNRSIEVMRLFNLSVSSHRVINETSKLLRIIVHSVCVVFRSRILKSIMLVS